VVSPFAAGKRPVLEMHRSCHPDAVVDVAGQARRCLGSRKVVAEKLCKPKPFGANKAAFAELSHVACGPRLATFAGAADRPMKRPEHLS
jgi:hypothetical protein